jgi:predicted transcriptional regulator of viral defense system
MSKALTTIAPSAAANALVAQGRYWAATAELEALTGQRGATLRVSLARLIKQGEFFSPARGLYVVVPPEYRSWRVLPAEWFIDPLMKHLARAYYVSFLSAAAMHGAAHQAPQTFRVVTDRSLADRDIERVQLRFTVAAHVRDMPTEPRTVPTGSLVLATRETTVVDLAWRPMLGAGISNVATIVQEIGELDGEALARIAPRRSRATARRVGWLLERFRPDVDSHWLRVVSRPGEGEPALLVPGRRTGPLDKNWGLRLNATVESEA